MSIQFNFTRLQPLLREGLRDQRGTIGFELANGRGRFAFFLLLCSDTQGKVQIGNLTLRVLLIRTQRLLSLRLFGSHLIKGDFKVYLTPEDERAIRSELGIESAAQGHFSLMGLLETLNSEIPSSLPYHDSEALTHTHRALLEESFRDHIDDPTYRYLLHMKRLPPNQRPREETLRKALMYLDGDSRDIAKLVVDLRRANITLCWTDQKPDGDKFAEVWDAVYRG